MRVIRAFRPHVMTTYDEKGGYPHPDHIMCHTVSMAAFEAAGDPDALPARRRALAAAQALLQRRLVQARHRGDPRRHARRGAREPVCRVAGELEAAPFGPCPRRRSRAASTSRRVTARCWPTRRRSTRTASGSRCRSRSSSGSGASRSSRRPCRYVPIADGEDDLFAGLGSAGEADALRDPARPRARPRRTRHRGARGRGGRDGARSRPWRQLRDARRRGRQRVGSEKVRAR